jgi:hypothetical protein
MITPPPQARMWPSIGEMSVKTTLQFATPTTDTMGGRAEPLWTNFGTWFVKVTVVPIVPNETDAVILYEVEGKYRKDVINYFNGISRPPGVTLPSGFTGGLGIRVVTGDVTLKVFQIENPYLRNRTLVAHCANAVNTQ